MHPNPIFREGATDRNLAFLRARSFGVLSVNGSPVPLMAHVPFVLSAKGDVARLHLVRSNPIARQVTQETPAVIAVSGPDSYISPDWYETPDQVPTWNYIAVHIQGVLRPMPPAQLREDLAVLSAHFEGQLLPKPQWLMDKMDAEALTRMMRMILPFRFEVQAIEGTWKLNQNKTTEMRRAASDAVAQHGLGMEVERLADWMSAEADH